VMRPSGTEPKLKVYFEVVTAPTTPEHLAEQRSEADLLLGSLKDDVATRCQ